MGTVFIEVSLSLDGMIAGPGVSSAQPMGRGGDRLHAWQTGDEPDRAEAASTFAGTGAFIVGRRTFDAAFDAWGEDGAFGMPVFVVTNRPQQPVRRGDTRFAFMPGIGSALAAARVAAGAANVCVIGGAEIARQVLTAGLADELRIHLVPVVLGDGTPFFAGRTRPLQFRPWRAIATRVATHLVWRTGRDPTV